MWSRGWRERVWSQLDQPWDIIVVGGGIVGAGILREATRLGLRTLLVEQRDLAYGTSSRSSKLVHGGLRYLVELKVQLTRAAVREREHLLEQGPGLIDPLGFLFANYKGDHPGYWAYQAGLSVYDLLALQWSHRHYSAEDFEMLAPHIAQDGLKGGFRYGDAQTDDARLVLRVIQEAVAEGGTALNYARAEQILRGEGSTGRGTVRGIRLRDVEQDRVADVYGRVVINATGAWADRLRAQVDAPARIRPLRGSHLIFPAWRVPIAQAMSFLHPVDRRPVFIFPWEGITLVGTTDVDHEGPLDDEPAIAPAEVSYLMTAVQTQFPCLGLTSKDVLATFSGVRPVIGSGKADPSKESRDHVIWEENGLLTITGGKLTTFRVMALDALRRVRRKIRGMRRPNRRVPVLNPTNVELPRAAHLSETQQRRLVGRYGACATGLVAAASPAELEIIPDTRSLWAELRWAARAEGVVHLDDLLLRRVRLGLVLPEGGRALLPRIRSICQSELGWEDKKWQAEEDAYLERWRSAYAPPGVEMIRNR